MLDVCANMHLFVRVLAILTCMITVSAIHIFPVKSMAGWSPNQAEVVDSGFAHDREWMVVDEQYHFVSQRQFPAMALVRPSLRDSVLELEAPGHPILKVPILTTGRSIATEVYTGPCQVLDQGDAAAAWLTTYLGKPCRLVRMDPSYKRPLNEKYRVSGDEVVGFADRLPFLLVTEASLADLNHRLAEPVTIDRFRANIVLAGDASPYVEETWKKLQIGSVLFRTVKPCDRCEIITVDQATGQKGTEPLETLGTYRTQPKGVMFGEFLIQESRGTVSVGDKVDIIA